MKKNRHNAICIDLAQEKKGILTGGGIVENIGLGYVAGMVEKFDYEIEMYQLPLSSVTHEEVLKKAIDCELVVISSMIYNARTSIQFAQKVKKYSPQTKIIVGGGGPSGYPELFAPYFDAVIVGEGELGIISCLRDKKMGIIKAGRNMHWDGHPWPIRSDEILQKSQMCGITPIPHANQKVAAISYSRGCPNNCWFCCSPSLWERKINWRSERDVVDEIEFLRDTYGVNMIDFCDPTFNASEKRVSALCEELIQRKNKSLLFATCDLHDYRQKAFEMFSLMKKAGFYKVAFGLEGSSSEQRMRLGKNNENIDHCYSVMRAASDAGLLIRAYLILGTPTQTWEDVESLKNILRTWPIDEIRVSIFCPFPGTQSWTDLQPIIMEKDFCKYDSNWPIIKHPVWNNEEIFAIRKEIARHFYCGPAYQSRKRERIFNDPDYQVGYNQLEKFLCQAELLA